MKRRLIYLGAFVLIIGGFILVKAPTPPISIAAEPIKDFGGYTVTNTILSFWLIMILMSIMVFFVYRRVRNVEQALVPSGLQNVIEALLEAFFNVVKLVAGEKNGRRFFPVIAGIFLILLFSNWFGLFPWNNVIGRTVDVRFEHLEVLEEDGEEILAELNLLAEEGKLSAAQINRALSTTYIDPIPFEVDHLGDANVQIQALFAGQLSARELAVREHFQENPLAAGSEDLHGDLEGAFEELIAEYPASSLELEFLDADGQEQFLEKAIVFNLPLPASEVSETELKGAEFSGGGVNFIPIKAQDFEYNPYLEPVVVRLNAEGGIAAACLYDTTEVASEDNPAPAGGERIASSVT
ncbi:MAG: F0F1 ATP synthase subunit A, partial [Dehalococcoidia bacterium]